MIQAGPGDVDGNYLFNFYDLLLAFEQLGPYYGSTTPYWPPEGAGAGGGGEHAAGDPQARAPVTAMNFRRLNLAARLIIFSSR